MGVILRSWDFMLIMIACVPLVAAIVFALRRAGKKVDAILTEELTAGDDSQGSNEPALERESQASPARKTRRSVPWQQRNDRRTGFRISFNWSRHLADRKWLLLPASADPAALGAKADAHAFDPFLTHYG
jgi:hypothetical protein